MKNKTKLSILLISLPLLLFGGFVFAQEVDTIPEEITDTVCDTIIECPEGLECISFPNIGLRCAQSNPCDYYRCDENTTCVIAESYPVQLHCSPNMDNDLDNDLDSDIDDLVSNDEDVEAEDLDTKEPNLLPDSPFYFLKNWGRGIQSFFAFNPIKKAELKLKFSNEKLLELRRLQEQNKGIEDATRNYQNGLDDVKIATEEINNENGEIDSFLDKFTKHQILHQKILQKLESQVPADVLEKITEVRENHLEKFGEVMIRLEENKEKITERLNEQMNEIEGSKYKHFKNLEVLMKLEEKVPENAREAIQKSQENSLKRLKGNLEGMSPEDQEKFKLYLDKIGGNKTNQLEILDNLKLELKNETGIVGQITEARHRIMERVRNTIQSCPEIEKPTPGFCQDGRIALKKIDNGCIVSFECLLPGEIEIPIEPDEAMACITLWNPVCGQDGKTYSNTCFAKLAETKIEHEGRCREKECETNEDCPQLRCGAIGTITSRCIGLKSVCVDEKCQIVSSEEVPLLCNKKCKEAGYSLGTCRDWTVTLEGLKNAGCQDNERNIGQTSDCTTRQETTTGNFQQLLGTGKACCCKK